MRKKQASFDVLQNFLPDNTYTYIVPFIEQYTIHLTITKDRKQVLGDYRNPTPDKPFHRISINGTLNKYSFLITLLHEIAHLITFVHHQHKVSPHGKEWKSFFSNLLAPLMGKNIFPSPNRSPTTFMPAISGPSITSMGFSYKCLHSSTSASMC